MIHIAWPHKPPLGTPINPAWAAVWGLVADWPMWEGSGDKIFDQSGNGNNGQLNGFDFPGTLTSGWGPGKDGRLLRLDGGDDFSDHGDSSVLEIGNEFTIVARIYLAAAGSYPAIVTKTAAYNESTCKYAFYLCGGTRELSFAMGGDYDSPCRVSGLQVPLNQWSFVAVTDDGTTATLYLNEQTWTKASLSGPVYGAETFKIGAWLDGSGHFSGLIDFVSVFNRAHTLDSVMSLKIRPWQRFDYVLPFSVVLGGITVAPAAIYAVGAVVNPTVVRGSLAVVPSAISAVGVVVNPTVVRGSLAVAPAAISAVGVVVNPTVVKGSLSLVASAISAVVSVVNPTVVIGAARAVGRLLRLFVGR